MREHIRSILIAIICFLLMLSIITLIEKNLFKNITKENKDKAENKVETTVEPTKEPEKRTTPPDKTRIIPGYENETSTNEVIKKAMFNEEEAYSLFAERGFFDVTYSFSEDGDYLGKVKIVNLTEDRHPTYQCNYVTEDGSVWEVYIINDSIYASLVAMEYDDEFEEQVVVSETDYLTSYNNITNEFEKIIPDNIKLIKVNKLDADFLFKVSKSIVKITTTEE